MIKNGSVIWITGLSGAGKTTLARALNEKLPDSILLDGDELRSALGVENRGFDYGARKELAFCYARLAKLLASQGFTVIVATISLFHEIHEWNRKNFPGYYEIFLNISEHVRRQRDPKGLYKKEHSGKISDMAGSGVKVEEPLNPDLTFTENDSLASCVEKILMAFNI